MVRKLIEWALNNPAVVFAYIAVVIGLGIYSYWHINIEAYPDPAPPIIELTVNNPGASAEEMERLVTIPMEVNLSGMPGCRTIHTKSLFELTHVRCIFEYGVPYYDAQQQVINRLSAVYMTVPLPPGVQPNLSPANPIAEIYRYVLKSPKNALGEDLYTLGDLKSLEDWKLEREFRRVTGVFDISSFGGMVRRYEIHPDPDAMKRYGITLQALSAALANSNVNVSGDFLKQGTNYKVVIARGLIGGHKDALEHVVGMKTPEEAAAYLRRDERIRCNEIRSIVLVSINDKPIKIDDIVDGGPLPYPDAPSSRGVVVGNQTRLGRISYDQCLDHETGRWIYEDEKVQGVILMRKNTQTMPCLERVKAVVDRLNGVKRVQAEHWYERLWDWITGHERIEKVQGELPPGVELQMYYDRSDLVDRTGHTVRTNLFSGIALVVVILMMFISNVRTAFIVAINMPLALLFSYSVLYFRGKSANLLSIGAVDFGIICDSTVIIVENIYRNLATGENKELPMKDRILRAVREVDTALFFSTLIMVVAFMPLFTLQGAEGELFGPMAQTYAFALAGALFFAMTLTPVLCMYMFKGMKPAEDNFFVRFVKGRYLWQLKVCLNYRWTTIFVMLGLIVITALWPLRYVGREFMPELEEGNLWIRGVFPINENLDAVKEPCKKFREIVSAADYTVTDKALASLRREGVPENVLAKLDTLNADAFLAKNGGKEKVLDDPKLKDAYEAKIFDSFDSFAAELRTRLDVKERRSFLHTIAKHTVERKFPEVEAILMQMGRPDDGTDPSLFNNVEVYVPFRKHKDWPEVTRPNGEVGVRTRREITADLTEEFARKIPGVEWAFSQYIRDNVMEGMTGVKGDNCVKIYGPDLEGLEVLAEKVKDKLMGVRGVEDVGIYRVMGQSNLEFVVDKKKCERFGLQVADVAAVIGTLVHAAPMTQMVEGEKQFDVSPRLPFVRRQDEASIFDATVNVWNRSMTPGSIPAATQTILNGPSIGGPSPWGTSNPYPLGIPSQYLGPQNQFITTVHIRDVVSPVDEFGRAKASMPIFGVADNGSGAIRITVASTAFLSQGQNVTINGVKTVDGKEVVDHEANGTWKIKVVDGTSFDLAGSTFKSAYKSGGEIAGGEYTRPAGSIISRELGKRFIAVKFAVRDRDLASAVAEVERKTNDLIQAPYRAQFGGEFEQMQDAEERLMIIIPASIGLICILLYVAFRSFLDVVVILSNLFDVAVGGIWALYLTDTHFNVSSAIGFVSLFGVAIMEGLLMISYFNDLRHKGLPLDDAIIQGASKRVRPVMITALTAIFGLLPDALSSAMGNQSAKPLAIVVVGGMAMTLFLDRYLMPVLYSFYGHREPPKDAASLAH